MPEAAQAGADADESPSPDVPAREPQPGAFRATEYLAPVLCVLLALLAGWWILARMTSAPRVQPGRDNRAFKVQLPGNNPR